MNWLALLKAIPLLTPVVEAVRGWVTPRRKEDVLPGDATASRHGTDSGSARNYSSKKTELDMRSRTK